MAVFSVGETCIEAMTDLARDRSRHGPHFGLTGRNDGKLEKAFQEALKQKLADLSILKNLNIVWEREIRYKTRALTNKDYVVVDIVGIVENELVAAIELKYVIINYKNTRMKSSDGYAVPYNIAKDCIKLELLIDKAFGGLLCSIGTNAPSKISPQLQTCAIALTNCHDFGAGWSGNFGNRLNNTGPVQLSNEPSQVLPRIEVLGKKLDEIVYLRKRAHISFGLTWKGQWRHYEVAGNTTEFRYLLLIPSNETTRPIWPNLSAQVSDTLPLSNAMRDEYDRIAAHLDQSKRATFG